MPSITLPDFYMPYPARLNPHLDAARAQNLVWARQVGMLDPVAGQSTAVWDEERFLAMDFALFAAWTHPDAPAEELNLISNWYIWGWYVDDYFPQAYRSAVQLRDARDYLSRLLRFMPTDGSPPPAEPENPLEHGLAGLWARTTPGKTQPWLERYVATVRDMAQEALRELYHLGRDGERVLDPLEYLALRRSVGGMPWSAQLLEHALGMELPPAMVGERTLQVLISAFSDAQGLQNDIISYDIDMAEGKVNNGVTVTRHFLGCGTQEAADFLDDVVTDRLHQFQNTAATELPAAFEEHRLDPATRTAVLRYVQGLQDWMAGNLEWALRPGGRYLPADHGGARPAAGSAGPLSFLVPTGIGTAAARLGLTARRLDRRARSYRQLPGRPQEQLVLPEFHMPWPARVNPDLEGARIRNKEWIRGMGMLSAAGLGVWSEQAVDSADYGLFGALINPDAPAPELDLINNWYAWGFFLDDYLVEVFKRRRDLVGARAFTERLTRFAPPDGLTMPVPSNPAEAALADVWRRTAPSLPDRLRHSLSASIGKHADAALWEVLNLMQNRVPEVVDHAEMRRLTIGVGVCTDLVDHTSGGLVPDAVMESPSMRRVNTAIADWAGWLNDVVSYQVETEYEHEVTNGVLALLRFADCTLPQAVKTVNDLLTARLHEFEHLVSTELPALYAELDLGAVELDGLARYVGRLRDWMSGYHAWHLRTGRYTDFRTRRIPVATVLRGPTGLGTSAARIRRTP
ncbi:terpene synthase family protein [Streptomyces sp. NPDC004126]|uniref:terpene synthase family protein n=1 Tax=Streptomyces sp. NPDC004126 TaxID=3390695 RepID=UPI003CFBEFD1